MGYKITKDQLANLEAKGAVVSRSPLVQSMIDQEQDRRTPTQRIAEISGRWIITIPNWRPTYLNKLMRGTIHQRIRFAKHDSEMIGLMAHIQACPKAACRRRVSMEITLGPRQKAGDVDSCWKTVLDGLVTCGRLVNDNDVWCALGEVTWLPRGSGPVGTCIILEDMP